VPMRRGHGGILTVVTQALECDSTPFSNEMFNLNSHKDDFGPLRQRVHSVPDSDRFLRYEASLERSIDRTPQSTRKVTAGVS
jgi:hypothetical protein